MGLKETDDQSEPTTDQVGEALRALEDARNARNDYLRTKAAAQEAYDRTVKPARAKYDEALGKLLALTSTCGRVA